MRRLVPVLAALAPLAACVSSSGVEGSLLINSLSPSDWSKYCNWYNGEVSSVVGKSCPGGSILPNLQLDCAAKNPAPATCPANVAQIENCARTYRERACDGLDKVLASPGCMGVTAPCRVLFVGSNFN